MFNGLKDMGKLMKQAKEMKSKLKTVQSQLKNFQVSDDYKGRVSVTVNGEMEIISITISPDFLSSASKEDLEKATRKATNSALEKAKSHASKELTNVTGGLDLPGL